MPVVVTTPQQHAALTLERSQRQAARALERLTSGVADSDASSTGLADRLEQDVRVAGQATRGLNDALAATRVGDHALAGIQDDLTRLQTLAEAAASDTLPPARRDAVQEEFQQLRDQLDQVAHETEFNGIHLLRRGDAVVTDAGGFGTFDTSTSALGVAGASVATADAARAALQQIAGAQEQVSFARGTLDAVESRLQTGIRNKILAQERTLSAAEQISSTDVAQETASGVAAQVRAHAGVAVQAQANLDARQALRLLGQRA